MRVILLKDIKNLGRKNEIKNVSDGYARNLLLPRKLAAIATVAEVKKVEEKKAEEKLRAEKDLEKNQEIVAKMEGLEIEIMAKTDKEGNLYAALSPAQISKALQAKGFEIKKGQVKIDEPIKEIGEAEVVIEFPHGLEAKIKIIVIEEK